VRELTPEAFAKLLGTLDPDPQRAAEKYDGLWRRLAIFFDGRSCGLESDVLADRTLDLVGGKLLEGSEIHSPGGISAYCLGVARNIWRDWLKRPRTSSLEYEPATHPGSDAATEVRLHCLEVCLERLPPESRKLILDFYQGERRGKIENRQRLADTLLITPNALRRRTHAIRVKLEACARECVADPRTAGMF
jgi:hypothetical protein